MSLIADALKKAQSAKLGRRYLPDAGGVLPGNRESRRAGPASGSLFRQINFSPLLLAGVGSGLVLFIVLFGYFFYGRSPRAKPSPSSTASLDNRPTGLILTPPPSVQPVEPLSLEKEALPLEGAEGQPSREKTPEMERAPAAQESPGSDRAAKVERPRVQRKPSAEAGKSREPQKSGEGAKVAVTSDLSEEVRYHFNLALFYQEEKNFPQARRTYEKVVQLWPLYAEAHNNLGVVYKELGMYEQAISQLKKALALNPRYARAYHNLGVVYQIKTDWKQATKNYEMALSLNRNHLSSYNNLGLVHRAQKRPHEAREVLEKALAIDPSFPQTHYNLALVLEEIGETDRARTHYQKFIDLAGEDNSRLVETVRSHLQALARR